MMLLLSVRNICLTCSTHLLHPLRVLLLRPACPRLAPPPPWVLCSLFPVYIIVTVQIYLSRSAKRTVTSGSPAASPVTARSANNPQQTSESSKAGVARKGGAAKMPAVRKTPSFNLHLRKSGSLSSYSPLDTLDTPSYRSPIKSPSQYFQICY